MAEPVSDDDKRKWHRWFAVEANNRAWALSERDTLTDDERVEILLAAHAAAYHWYAVGTATQRAHADLLLGRVYALLGHAGPASQFALRAFEGIKAGSAEAWELAFAHAVMANAAAAAGGGQPHIDHYAEAVRLGESLDAEDRDIFLKTFKRIPVP